jgi:hypothetical protein
MGIRTTNIDSANMVDELIGHRDGSTVRIKTGAAAAQLVAAFPGPQYETRAELHADLNWPASARALVWGDAAAGYNGQYLKAGPFGAGTWNRFADLPLTTVDGLGSIVRLTGVAGSGDAITATIPAAQSHITLAVGQ